MALQPLKLVSAPLTPQTHTHRTRYRSKSYQKSLQAGLVPITPGTVRSSLPEWESLPRRQDSPLQIPKMGPARGHLTHPVCLAGLLWGQLQRILREGRLVILHLTLDHLGSPSCSLTHTPIAAVLVSPPCLALLASESEHLMVGMADSSSLRLPCSPENQPHRENGRRLSLGPLPLHPSAPSLTPLFSPLWRLGRHRWHPNPL